MAERNTGWKIIDKCAAQDARNEGWKIGDRLAMSD
jgi:hypothetical protein